ncbi:hypothetical protein AAC387_Pa12g0620 [Persea americana]
MASGSRSGGNDNPDYFVSGNEGPTPPAPNSDVKVTAILEQLVRSNEQMAKSHEAQLTMHAQIASQTAKSHEARLTMQAQIASILQVQSQLQAQMHAPPVPPVQPQHNVETQVVVQPKEKDPNILFEQFQKRGAIEFYGTKDVMQAHEWLQHIDDVFDTMVCTQ